MVSLIFRGHREAPVTDNILVIAKDLHLPIGRYSVSEVMVDGFKYLGLQHKSRFELIQRVIGKLIRSEVLYIHL